MPKFEATICHEVWLYHCLEVEAATETEAREAVDKLLDEGVDLGKVINEAGHGYDVIDIKEIK